MRLAGRKRLIPLGRASAAQYTKRRILNKGRRAIESTAEFYRSNPTFPRQKRLRYYRSSDDRFCWILPRQKAWTDAGTERPIGTSPPAAYFFAPRVRQIGVILFL